MGVLMSLLAVVTRASGIALSDAVGGVEGTCEALSAVEVLVRGRASEGAIEYEVQAGIAAEGRRGVFSGWPATVSGPVLSMTASLPLWRLDDLLPDTRYEFRMRVRRGWPEQEWSDLGRPLQCATPSIRPRQALLLPPTEAPSRDSVAVRLQLPPHAVVAKVEVIGGAHRLLRTTALTPNRRNFTLRVYGLKPGTAYSIRVAAMFADGATGEASPAVRHRTADSAAAAEWVRLYRVSEFCGQQRSCAPDYLANHNSASSVAAINLLRIFRDARALCSSRSPPAMCRFTGDNWTRNAWAKLLPHSFGETVTTRYCVRRPSAAAWADYVSCNAVPSSPYDLCRCKSFNDRCRSRDTSRGYDDPAGAKNCPAPFPVHERPAMYEASYPKCECEAERESYSQRALGRMPLYQLPRDTIQQPPQYARWRCLLPPLNETAHLGWYFSTPAAGECAAGELPSVGACGWAREPRQSVVTGVALLEREGFDARLVHGESHDFAQDAQNSAVMDGLLDTHGSRCCGC